MEISKNVVVVIRRELCRVAQTTFALGLSSAIHRWPPLRRGRRHHGGSMTESCLGALIPNEKGSLRRSECGTLIRVYEV